MTYMFAITNKLAAQVHFLCLSFICIPSPLKQKGGKIGFPRHSAGVCPPRERYLIRVMLSRISQGTIKRLVFAPLNKRLKHNVQSKKKNLKYKINLYLQKVTYISLVTDKFYHCCRSDMWCL